MTNLEIINTKIHLATKGNFDWKFRGKTMYRFIYPEPVSRDATEIFKDEIEEIVEEKLKECLIRFKKLEKLEKECVRWFILLGWDKNELLICKRMLAEALIEKKYIQKWERYWLDQAQMVDSFKPRAPRLDKISDSDVARAKEHSIESLFGNPLRSMSGKLMGKCPFHEEKTPSFVIYEDTNTYHCFGCGAHGDSINFLMDKEDIGFVEAVKRLC